MSTAAIDSRDPRIQVAVRELQDLIASRYPEATFDVSEGDDPVGVYLTATVDTDDLTSVLELVGDRLVDLQVEQNLPLYLVPVRPVARGRDQLHRPKRRVRPASGVEAILPQP